MPPAGPLTRRPARQQVNALILQGQWWRLVTPAFLHGNLVHLAVNCYSLYSLAPIVETLSGGPRLAAVYLAAAVAGNVASFYGSAAPSLGASGAVFGVGGALAVYFYRNKGIYGKRSDAVLRQLGNTLFINLVFGMTNARIDNWCALPPLRAAPLRRAAGGLAWRLPWQRRVPRQCQCLRVVVLCYVAGATLAGCWGARRRPTFWAHAWCWGRCRGGAGSTCSTSRRCPCWRRRRCRSGDAPGRSPARPRVF